MTNPAQKSHKKETQTTQKKAKSLWKEWTLWVPVAFAAVCLYATLSPKAPSTISPATLKTWLIDTPTNFSPNETNRIFWTQEAPTIPVYSPPSKPLTEMDARELTWKLYEGTPSLAANPNGGWSGPLNGILLQLCNIPWDPPKLLEEAQNSLTPEPINLTTTLIAANMAATIRLLPKSIPKETAEKVRQTINNRIIDPYLQESERFQKNGKTGYQKTQTFWIGTPDNWTAVCLANIAYASLAINNKEKNSIVLDAVLRDLPPYLESFDNDGYFPGGIRYWEYGFGHFILLNETLAHATEGKINFYPNQKIREAIHFPERTRVQKRSGTPPQNPNTPTQNLKFGDNHGHGYLNRWIWDILNLRYKTKYEIPSRGYPENFFPSLPIVDLVLNPPKLPQLNEEQTPSTDTFFTTAGVLLSRSTTEGLSLATKGNHNAEENAHNQNDVGSYTVYHKGRYLTGDPGGGTYEGAFGPKRFTRDLESSWGHPVPVIDGQLQPNGRDFHAKVLQTNTSPERSSITYDLSPAYPVDGLKKLHRTINFDKKTQTVEIRDTFEANRPILFESAIIQGTALKNPSTPAIQVQTSAPYRIKESYLSGNDEFNLIRRVGIELERRPTGWIQYSIKSKKSPAQKPPKTPESAPAARPTKPRPPTP
jgi:hypothetical protein